MKHRGAMKNFILILLAFALVLGLWACKKNEDEPDAESDGIGSEESVAEDTAEDTTEDTDTESDTESDTDTDADTESESEEDTEIPVEDISLSDYTLIRPDKASERLLDAISDFYGSLIMLTGKSNLFTTDYVPKGESVDPEALEILIGHTNRPETQQVLSEISGDEYAVAVVGKKIVITGKTDSVTVAAVDYFIENYLGEDSEGVVAGDLFYKASTDVALLIDNGSVNCEFVRPDKMDHMNTAMLKKLYNITRAQAGVSIATVNDSKSTDSDKVQILFGYTSRQESLAVRESTAPEGYTIDFINNKIVIFAWTAEAMQEAIDRFSDILTYSCYVGDDGKTTMCILKERISSKQVASSYYKDVPFKAGNVAVDSIYDAHDNTMMLYWKNANADMYSSYVKALEAMGFTKYQSGVENSSIVSATYVKGDASAHVYLLKRTGELRVITEKGAALPVNTSVYTKVCDVAVTQLGLDYTTDNTIVGGMGYLIRLEDGSFVVIDGGDATAKGKENLKNAENLYELMIAQKPQGIDDVVISAWIVTHGHSDHFGVYNLFAKYYADKVTVKRLVGNDMSDFIYENLDNPSRAFDYSERAKAFEGCEYLKLHTGQSLQLPGVIFNALYTHEDVYPDFMLELNSTASMIVDAVIEEKEKDTRIVFVADLTETGAARLVKMYREDMKCDIMQVGHHGNKGGSYDLYSLCDPDVVLWPAASHYPDEDHIKGQSQNKWIFENVETIIRSGDGNHTINFGEKVSIDDGASGGTDEDGDYTQRY